MYGVLSILPVIILLVLIILTKKMIEPMIAGICVALIIQYKWGFAAQFADQIQEMLRDETYTYIILSLCMFGAFLGLIQKSGGVFKFGELAQKYVAKSQKSTLITTWIFGIVIFIDEYLNNLAIGTSMRDLGDKHKVPREMMAMTINGTGTSVTSLIPLNAFVVFVFSLMNEEGVAVGESLLTGYGKVIPFAIYSIVAVVMIPLIIYGIIPRVGTLKKAYERAEKGIIFPEGSEIDQEVMQEELELLANKNSSLIDFFLPIATVIVVAILTDINIIYGIFAGVLTCAVLYIPTKKMSVSEFMDNVIDGIKDMIFIAVLICLAFVFVNAVKAIGFIEFVLEFTKPLLIGEFIPVLTFVIVGLLVFIGVDFWGALALFMPIVVPLSEHFGVNVYLTIGALVSATIFGSHSCFFTESMVMSAQSCQIKPYDEAVALFPYAILGAIITSITYLILGFTM